MTKILPLFIISLLINIQGVKAQKPHHLQQKIEHILKGKNAVVGVAVANDSGDELVVINGNRHFPMQSIFKLPLAFYVLSEVDKGKLSLEQEIKITKKDLLLNTWSPIREKYPNGTTLLLSELIQYTVAQSDNNGADILLRLVGGAKNVENYLHSVGIKAVSIKYNEEEMHANWDNQYENWITPEASDKMLHLFLGNNTKLLSSESHQFILGILKGTTTGIDKIKGKLPKNTIVAHKTGNSGTNSEGITAAENDIGMVVLPNGKHFYISVFVTDSKEKPKVNKRMIAQIAKASWDFYTRKAK